MDLTLHTLGAYIDLLQAEKLVAAPLPPALDLAQVVTFVSYDSRQIVPGTLFFCKGRHFTADYLLQAAQNGAIAYVSEITYPDSALPCIQVSDMRRTLAPMADLYYNHPSQQIKVFGLTGTKGKSTSGFYMKYILDAYMQQTGKGETAIVSSIDTYDGVERFKSHITTPEPFELQRHFRHALDSGIEYLTMEVSSQALKYHRSRNTKFAAVGFLNIGNDHISPIEHPDFEDYFSSKLKIFNQSDISCVNLDSAERDRVLSAAKQSGGRIITFSRSDPAADIFAFDVEKEGQDICFRVKTPRYTEKIRLTMPGLFNVENALAAIALCEGEKIPADCIKIGLERARVPGRMEVYSSADNSVTAIVDFAHNRMSFETLFSSTKKEYPGRRIVAVFGCTGDKGLDRREEMGSVAGQYSDFIFLTEDDSGKEDTRAICEEIAGHVRQTDCPYAIEINRGEAIRRAILSCNEPTVLLITGKGQDAWQKRGAEYVETPTDVEYVETFLREYDAQRNLTHEEQRMRRNRAEG